MIQNYSRITIDPKKFKKSKAICKTYNAYEPYLKGEGAPVIENGEETPLKSGDFALLNPDKKHQYENKADKAF